MQTIWKKMKKPFSKYSVSNKGNVRNDKTGYVFNNNSMVGNYIRVRLVDDNGKSFNTLMHRAVAIAFLPNSEGKKFVDHINRNPMDNRVENLRWVSREENSDNQTHKNSKKRAIIQFDLDSNFIARYERTIDAPFPKSNIISACSGRLEQAYGYKWKYDEESLDGEEFRLLDFNGREISVSNKGRIRMPSGLVTYGNDTCGGYKSVNINAKGILVHKLVAMAFMNKLHNDSIIHHMDSNKQNNDLANLEYITQSQNSIHAHNAPRKKTDGYIRKVESRDSKGEIKVYDSIASAHRLTGISSGNICMCCKGQRPLANGLKWNYV